MTINNVKRVAHGEELSPSSVVPLSSTQLLNLFQASPVLVLQPRHRSDQPQHQKTHRNTKIIQNATKCNENRLS